MYLKWPLIKIRGGREKKKGTIRKNEEEVENWSTNRHALRLLCSCLLLLYLSLLGPFGFFCVLFLVIVLFVVGWLVVWLDG